jgi:hypothetical protein
MENTIMNIDVETDINEVMNWKSWSDKSKDISFESTTTGVGDGEEKVARELDTNIFGQNSHYDMKPIINGIPTKCDVKKLDKQDDFNTGKEGRDALRPSKTLITNLLDNLNYFAISDVFTLDEKKELSLFHDVSPDELSKGTLKKLNKICAMLSLKKNGLRSTIPSVPFTVNSQTNHMPIDLYYTICQKLELVFPSEYEPFIETIQILQRMDHVYINEPEKLVSDLDSLVGKIFTDIKIIIADKEKGYMIIEDTSKIHFYRITRGTPRFQIIF